MTSDDTARGRCPICGKPSSEAVEPFCSKRCADVDLQRWLAGSYAIPVAEEDAERPEEGSGEGEC
jgi:endogenous inhibitor of DNA gyrase (YacG/DUF329 family)